MYAKTKQFNPTTQLGGLWQKKGGNILCSLLSVRPGCLEPSAAQGHLGFVPPFGYLTRCFRTCSQIFPLEEFPLGGLTLSNLLIKLKNIRLGAVGSNSLLVVQQLMGSVSDTATTQSSWHSAGTPSSAGLCWALLGSAGPACPGADVWQPFPCCGWQSSRESRASRAWCGFPGGNDALTARAVGVVQLPCENIYLGKPSEAFDLNSVICWASWKGEADRGSEVISAGGHSVLIKISSVSLIKIIKITLWSWCAGTVLTAIFSFPWLCNPCPQHASICKHSAFQQSKKGIAAEMNELKEVNKGLTIEANKNENLLYSIPPLILMKGCGLTPSQSTALVSCDCRTFQSSNLELLWHSRVSTRNNTVWRYYFWEFLKVFYTWQNSSQATANEHVN